MDHFVDNEGVRIHYRKYGGDDRPLLMFVHGFPDNFETWRSQIDAFSDRYTVVTPSLRGYPPSAIPSDDRRDYSRSHYVSDIVAVLDDIKTTKPIVLVAHDLGGAGVQDFALAYPERVAGLVLVNSPPFPTFVPLVESDPVQQEKSQYTQAYFDYEPSHPKNIAYVTRNIRDLAHRAKISSYMEENPIHGMLHWYKSNYPRPRHDGKVTDMSECVFRVPSLVVWGLEEEYFSPKMIDGMA